MTVKFASGHQIEDTKIIVRDEPVIFLCVFRSLMMRRNQRGVMPNWGGRMLQSTMCAGALFPKSRFAIEFHWLKLQSGDRRGARISTR